MSDDTTLNEFNDSEKGGKESGEGSVQGVEESLREMFGIGQIPRDWDIQPLANLSEIIAGNSPPSSTYNESGNGLPFFQGNSEFGHFYPEADTWCSEPRKVAEPDDILISIRAPVGDLNIANQRCCIGRGLTALRPNDTSGLYLYYHLVERKNWLSRLATGSTFKSITKGDLENLDIPYPALPEQRKIASVLYTVDQAIQKTQDIIHRLQKTLRGVRQEVMRVGTRGHQMSNSDSRFGEIPNTWKIESLGSIADVTGGSTPSTDEPIYWDGEIPWATPTDLTGLDEITISTTESYITEKGLNSTSTNLLPPQSVLMTSRATIGECAVNTVEMATNQGFQSLVPLDGIDTWYLYYRMEEEANYLNSLGSGSTFSEVSNTTVQRVKIPIPPVDEQKEIASVLKSIDETIIKEKEYKSQLQRFKQGLMQDLLSGKVRTTDANIDIPEEVAKYG